MIKKTLKQAILALMTLLLVAVYTTDAQQLVQRNIQVDISQIKGVKNAVFNECIGAGRANEGLRADWQKQLVRVQKDINFKYIRFHGLLHDDMGVYKEDKDGNPTYNWQYIDELYDFLLSIHIRPFVELSFMPSDLASGTKTIFWWKANVTKPKSYVKWDALITALVQHWKERYGEEELRKWYFEVWNEPDLKGFYDGTQADYFELYAHTAKAVKSVSSYYRVGGPATSATKWIPEFLSFCEQNQLPLDFISTHDYGTTSVLDEFGKKKQQLKSTPDTIAINMKRVKEQISASAYKNAEFHLTEWNSSPSSRDPIHDTYFNAAYLLNTLRKASLFTTSMSYWTFTDIFEEAGPGPTPFHGGFGLINLQNIAKPTYYAYKFLNQLGDKELKNSDVNSYVCTSNEGVQALIWNYKYPDDTYTYNQDYFNQDQPAKITQEVNFRIAHLKNGNYRVEIYKIGYQQSDPYSAYMKMGKPINPTKEEIEILKQQSTGKPVSIENVTINNGQFKMQLPLRDNDVVFMKLVSNY